MAINAYSLAKDGTKKLSTDFKVREFRCKDGSDPIFIRNWWKFCKKSAPTLGKQ